MAQNSLLDLQEMKPTPRNQLLGLLADALTAGRDFADKAKVPAVVPLLGGQGLGSLLLGKAPEELTNISYGNMPLRINPLAGRTASFVPEIKPGRKEQVADLAMALQAVPGGNRAALSALGAVDMGANKAAIVWHGSPHKFDRFDASKIGTGEGSQAYGHGLYLADNPTVANSYRAMAGNPGRRQAGLSGAGADQVVLDSTIQLTAKQFTGGDVGKLAELIQRKPGAFTNPEGLLKRIAEYEGNSPPSFIYKVDLPDEKIARMLDWDKPLSQQAPEVQPALRDMLTQARKSFSGIDPSGNPMAGQVHHLYVQHRGGNKDAPVKAADFLRQQGIPGIRYLDGGSRGAGAGTSNFVVFPGEEQFLRILERNGGLLGP